MMFAYLLVTAILWMLGAVTFTIQGSTAKDPKELNAAVMSWCMCAGLAGWGFYLAWVAYHG